MPGVNSKSDPIDRRLEEDDPAARYPALKRILGGE